MENRILFINACARTDSRTAELARYFLNFSDGIIKEVNLYNEEILPLNAEGLKKREFLNM